MNTSGFDTVSKLFAQRRLTRRQALAQCGMGLAAGGLAATGLTAASAQDASPVVPAADAEHGPEMLFVQSFESGTIVPKEGVDGRYTVTLEHGLGQTIYFSDRPDRIVGASPTEQFLKGLGFPPDNPPNAALVVETGPDETDLAVVELFSPVFDPSGPTVTYEMSVLQNWEDSLEFGLSEAPTDLGGLAPTFGAAHIFIDDCSTSTILCLSRKDLKTVVGLIGDGAHDGWCYSWGQAMCLPCAPWETDPQKVQDYWNGQCNATYADCDQNCFAAGVTND